MEFSYSTDPAWCPKCRHLPCACPKTASAGPSRPKGSGPVKIRREMRRGKPVIVLFELAMAPDALKDLLKEIQRACGAGGAVKEGTLEIQGDHREKIEEILAGRGLKVKRAGG